MPGLSVLFSSVPFSSCPCAGALRAITETVHIIREKSPYAFEELTRRLLEANQRGYGMQIRRCLKN
jgi:hypothetical protein